MGTHMEWANLYLALRFGKDAFFFSSAKKFFSALIFSYKYQTFLTGRTRKSQKHHNHPDNRLRRSFLQRCAQVAKSPPPDANRNTKRKGIVNMPISQMSIGNVGKIKTMASLSNVETAKESTLNRAACAQCSFIRLSRIFLTISSVKIAENFLEKYSH